MKTIMFLLILLCSGPCIAQGQLFEELPSMPEAVTNNAVTGAMSGDTFCVYSFCGLDFTKIWSGIHLKAWRMNTVTGEWSSLPSVPDPAGGKIAAAASTVKNRIYVIGGYHVAQNGSETSSNKVHRFDPQTNAWLSDGAPLPKAIDDHVQAVWRDSLIYVITGWSNTGNAPDVQIYNPSTDTWMAGTAVPNNVSYKVFGASGVIINDKIYYCGGAAAGINFPASSFFRTGQINPDNPADITWSGFNSAAAKGYRMAAGIKFGGPVWVGGSDVTYNYNGIAYDGTGGVAALSRRKQYFPVNNSLTNEDTLALPPVMDLRGTAQPDYGYFITAGGMGPGQQVSNRVFAYTWGALLDNHEPAADIQYEIYPNPASDQVILSWENSRAVTVRLFDALGREIAVKSGESPLLIDTGQLPDGMYWLQIKGPGQEVVMRKVIYSYRRL
jgi:hypothetical protein